MKQPPSTQNVSVGVDMDAEEMNECEHSSKIEESELSVKELNDSSFQYPQQSNVGMSCCSSETVVTGSDNTRLENCAGNHNTSGTTMTGNFHASSATLGDNHQHHIATSYSTGMTRTILGRILRENSTDIL